MKYGRTGKFILCYYKEGNPKPKKLYLYCIQKGMYGFLPFKHLAKEMEFDEGAEIMNKLRQCSRSSSRSIKNKFLLIPKPRSRK